MKKQILLLASLTLCPPVMLFGCSSPNSTQNNSTSPPDNNGSGKVGQLNLTANGEDFVRQGFTTKDGWQIRFDRVNVTLADVNAYQTDPPFDPEQNPEIKPQETIPLLEGQETIDLAEGDDAAEPILVTEVEASPGAYNALGWKVVKAESGDLEGQSIVMEGEATKDGKTVDFTIKLDRELDYTCGEFVGDDRKGIVQETQEGEVETTFHFDHIFGDGEASPEDTINVEAVGFDPLAALATDNTLDIDRATLQTQLDSETYQKLEKAIAGLGHVGEGHCHLSNP